MLDTGVNAAHPSFATVDGEGYVHENPLGSGNFLGVCDPSHPAHEDVCTDKLIGAYNFHPNPEFGPSVLDWDGHGSHVGSTIAGNVHEAAFTIGQDTFTRTVQGVAPRANVVSYLVCSEQCPASAAVAAVNQAIADEVIDVINYSISGADDPWNDPVDLAFLDAYEAGIFVSASAGNTGPGASTVAKTAPWNASVAASTHGRVFGHTLDVTGPAPVPPGLTSLPAPPGDGVQVTADIVDEIRFVAENPIGCDPFPAGALDGAIALVERGDCTFATKVENATDAGAVAVVFINTDAGPPPAPPGLAETTIPAVMIERDPGTALREFVVANPGSAEVRINMDAELFFDPESWEDVVAGFSSRGPSQFDLLAPTYTAPGVSILAAGAADATGPDNYGILSGTSMSSPHGAGSAALLMALHPEWSQSQVRSALAGTADPDVLRKEDGVTPADPFDQGSGRLDLAAAARVGLALDETHANFAAADPALGGDPKTLNVPSFVSQNCVPSCTWTRTLTSVADTDATYSVATAAPGGVTVAVTPDTFTIPAGGTVTVEVTVTAPGLSPGEWTFADIRLETAAQHAGGQPIAPVHYPVAVTAQAPALDLDPEQISAALGPDETATETLTIGNLGGTVLEWELVELAPAPVSVDQIGEPGTVTLWDQPANGTNGIVSDFYDDAGTGVYAADDFVLLGDVEIEEIFADGFFNTGSLAEANALSWFIYPDDGGAPAGHPEDGQDAHVWTYSTPPDGTGVTVTDNDITLDVVAATGSAATLEAGTYWLTVFPDIDGPCCSGATRWNWNQGTPQLEEAHLIDPGNLFGAGLSDWTAFSTLGLTFTDTAFRLAGTTDCSAGDIPWLEISPTSGAVDPLGSDEVAVTLDSSGLAAGEHQGTLCLATNDPANEVVLVPVTLEVEQAPEIPAIEVTPDSLTAELSTGEATEQALTISNVGEGELDWSIATAEPGPGEAGEPGGELAVLGPLTRGVAAITAAAAERAPGGGTFRTPPDSPAATAGVLEQTVQAADVIMDGGFEAGTPNPFWSEGSLSFGTPLCTVGSCGTGGGTGPHGGEWWTWFGGINALEIGFVSQEVTLEPGTAELRFWLEIPSASGTGNDLLTVSLDETEVFRVTDADAGGFATYTEVVVDVSEFADGGTHTLSLDSTVFGGGAVATNFFVDDVSLDSQPPLGPCGSPTEVSWLAASPESGTTPAGGSSEVTVSIDSTGLAAGDHEALLCVASNDPATPLVEVPVSLTVTEEPGPGPVCDQTILGVHPGPLTVSEGVTCLAAGAMVLGTVNVLPGAGLIATAAVVQGPVSAMGATVVDVAFSQVTGPVSIVGATGTVSLFGSQVTGSVALVNNSTGATPIVVAGNTVIGSLTCTGNEPPPTDHGLPNTVVGGVKVGQCAEL
jgi:subtilisin family serine protease